MTLHTQGDDDGRRLDRILRRALPDLPLSALHKLLRRGQVLVEDRPGQGRDRIPAGSRITIPERAEKNPRPSTDRPLRQRAAAGPGRNSRHKTAAGSAQIFPEERETNAGTGNDPVRGAAPLDILWEGGGLLILNKPAGLAVHGASAAGDTLEKRVRLYLAGRLSPSLSFTPGPLHRLDKPTSGIVVFSTTLNGARRFSALLREGKIRKRYVAILEGDLAERAVWEEDLYRDREERKTRVVKASHDSGDSGRRACTAVFPMARTGRKGKAYTLAGIAIETGRTHQIRAQAAHHGHPLAGDRKYGGGPWGENPGPGGFFLHAAELELPEDFPDLAQEKGLFRAPLPEPFSRAVRALFGP
ncbi:MAG: RluA family pseudouridine synthase [Spirochaetaceae bacterium]|jgi:23S rRNA pseudouridine955/2504/2580 synthase|nr:RluA family pseudouridine synthase [Spirochaetaceae bacterium]